MEWIVSQKTPNRFVTNRVNKISEISGSSVVQHIVTLPTLTREIKLKKFKEDMDEPVWFIESKKWPVWDGPTIAILCYTSTEEGVAMNN